METSKKEMQNFMLFWHIELKYDLVEKHKKFDHI